MKAPRGSASPNWKGGRKIWNGYWAVMTADHPHANSQGYVREHILVAERALGKILPRTAQVHHIDGDKMNNAPSNLIVCPDQAYHSLLHQRERALDACGHADWRKCKFCKEYDAPSNLLPGEVGRHIQPRHASCANKSRRERRAKRKAAAIVALYRKEEA